MESRPVLVGAIAFALSVAVMALPLQGQQTRAAPYNTVKTKLVNGQQVFGGTVSIASRPCRAWTWSSWRAPT